nr:chromosome partitioning protein [Micromonospora veneta]
MVHENADPAHLPGQPPTPERDIEPLWPPDPTEPAAAQPWAVPTQPAAPAWPTPPSGPRAAPATVDLDQPFTLDRPVATGPGTPHDPALAGSKGTPGSAPETDGPAGVAPGKGPVPADPTSGNGRAEGSPATAAIQNPGGSPWAQPPQRLAGGGIEPTEETDPTETTTGTAPGQDGATHPPAAEAPATGPTPAAPATGPAVAAPGTPRLGPFPPTPGVPIHQQPPPPGPYGGGATYPPAPGGQPGYPGASTYPPGPGPVAPPGWYPAAWPPPAGAAQQPGPPQQPVPQQPAPAAYPDPVWSPETGATPTAEDFARRRQARPPDPVATMGVRAVVNKMGLVRLAPGRHEQELKRDIEMVRRNFGGLRQVTVVNPKGGAGKTVAILLLAMTFGQKRGGYVLAWDNNETQGTLGMRAQQDFHSRTVRDMLRDLGQFQGAHGRVGDLSQYVRSQGEGMFDVLASDESATGGEMLTAAAFAEIREVVSRFYKLIFVDTGNNVRAQNWQAAMDATDQLVVTMSARNDSAETAARMLDHLEQSGRQRLVRQAVTVVSMPPSRKEIDLPAIQQHFAARTRAVLLAPYERLIDTGEPIRYGQLSAATRDAWLKIAAAVAEGL